MIPLKSILEAASKNPIVTKVAVGVLVLALLSYAGKIAFGSVPVLTTSEASDCGKGLSGCSARLELVLAERDRAFENLTRSQDDLRVCGQALVLYTGRVQ